MTRRRKRTALDRAALVEALILTLHKRLERVERRLRRIHGEPERQDAIGLQMEQAPLTTGIGIWCERSVRHADGSAGGHGIHPRRGGRDDGGRGATVERLGTKR